MTILSIIGYCISANCGIKRPNRLPDALSWSSPEPPHRSLLFFLHDSHAKPYYFLQLGNPEPLLQIEVRGTVVRAGDSLVAVEFTAIDLEAVSYKCVKSRNWQSKDEPQGLKPLFLAGFAAWLKPCPYELRQNPHL